MEAKMTSALTAIEIALRKFGKFSKDYGVAVRTYHCLVHAAESRRN